MSPLYSIGVMTGTSCDGADLALLKLTRTRGRVSETLLQKASFDFPSALRIKLRQAQKGQLNIREAAFLTHEYSKWLAQICAACLKKWELPVSRTIFGVHGQTVWHEPPVSVQLLDPTLISTKTGCTVLSAFRQPDLATGGQGAPLVPYYHWLRSSDFAPSFFRKDENFAIHNVGGISNLTYVPKKLDDVLAFDTGPGNALIDMAVEKFTKGHKKFDFDGKIAESSLEGIDWPAIYRLGSRGYFAKRPPKSTGRELFNENFLRKIPGHGAIKVANATALTAHTMAKAYADFVINTRRNVRMVFVAGGGAKNPTLLRLFSLELARQTKQEIWVAPLPQAFAPTQYLEAMAFARLAYEGLFGNFVSLAQVTGAKENAIGAAITPGKNFKSLF